MNYVSNNGLVHLEIRSPEWRRQYKALHVVYLACGRTLEEETAFPPWIYQRKTLRSPTCLQCMVRFLDDLGR